MDPSLSASSLSSLSSAEGSIRPSFTERLVNGTFKGLKVVILAAVSSVSLAAATVFGLPGLGLIVQCATKWGTTVGLFKGGGYVVGLGSLGLGTGMVVTALICAGPAYLAIREIYRTFK